MRLDASTASSSTVFLGHTLTLALTVAFLPMRQWSLTTTPSARCAPFVYLRGTRDDVFLEKRAGGYPYVVPDDGIYDDGPFLDDGVRAYYRVQYPRVGPYPAVLAYHALAFEPGREIDPRPPAHPYPLSGISSPGIRTLTFPWIMSMLAARYSSRLPTSFQ